jgi:RNA polymerase sigma-70 factor (ECF subfamily)
VSISRGAVAALPAGAALQGDGRWQYNRWLGRWRQTSVARRAFQSGSQGTPTAVLGRGAREAGRSPMPFDESDRTLVERVKGGDVRAFETLHRRYHDRIYRFAFLRLGNAEDAADVAAYTFCRALNSLHSYQFRRTSSLYPWLHQIASNLVVDVVRDRPPGGMLSLDAQAAEDVDSFLEYLPADGLSPQELVEREEVGELVRQAIEKLPADQARAISLRFLGDLSIREIAHSLDRTEGAVKSLLHRALQGVRQHLKSAIADSRTEQATASSSRQERAESNVPEVLHLRPRDS